MLEYPICEICLKTGILCAGCEEKLAKGEITKLDVELSGILYRLENKYKTLAEIKTIKTIDAGDLVVIITDEGKAGVLIGKGGKIVKTISNKLKRKVRVVEETKDYRRVAQDLLAPVRVVGINIVYPPKEEPKFKVLIAKQDLPKLPSDITTLEKILSKMIGKNVILAPA